MRSRLTFSDLAGKRERAKPVFLPHQAYPAQKLSEEDVRWIWEHRATLTAKKVAEKFNLSPAYAQSVLSGNTHPHIRRF